MIYSRGVPYPAHLRPLTYQEKQELFGPVRILSEGPGGLVRLNPDWKERNLVTVRLPGLERKEGAPKSGRVRIHRLIAPRLESLWAAWQAAGLLDEILTWDGSFAERFVRGRRTLSSHAFGIAFDLNARWNPLGQRPPAAGRIGSVLRLVPLANAHGFFWGGHFRSRPDGMHFEYARSE